MNDTVHIHTIGQSRKTIEDFIMNPKLQNRLNDLTKLKTSKCKRIGQYLNMWIGDYLVRYGNTQKFDRSKFMVLATQRATGKIVGAAGVILRRKTVYVDFICSTVKTVGSRMMHLIERIGKRRGKTGVELVSAPKATGFYTKRGYRRGPLSKTDATRSAAVKRYKNTAAALKHINPANINTNPMRFIDNIRHAAKGFTVDDGFMRKHFPHPIIFYDYLTKAAPGQYKRGFRGKLYLDKNELKHGLPKYSARFA